jgi:hypothetical protein
MSDEQGSEELRSKWEEVRRAASPSTEDEVKDSRSLYEQLQEQKTLRAEAEALEQRSRAAVRVVDEEDLRFYEELDRQQTRREEELEQQVREQMESIRANLKDKTTAIPPRTTGGIQKKGPSQKDLIKGIIKKKK